MNGPGREDILLFIERQTGKRLRPAAEADVLLALDLDGAEAAQFMQAFASAFGVDLAGYEAAFHHRDRHRVIRPNWPFPAPHLFGVRFPIPVSTLAEAARTGRWPMHYPMMTPAASRQWVNAPLLLMGLPIVAALALAVFRFL